MDKHTPGPWKYSTSPQPNGCPIIGNTKGLGVAMLMHSVNDAHHRETAIANAKLIAAAPDMLEALQELLLITGIDGTFSDKARAAIAKATGEINEP